MLTRFPHLIKKIVETGITLAVTLSLTGPILAQSYFGLQQSATQAQYGETNIYSTITTIISVGLSVIGIVFLAIMFYAGLRWMTARGNDELAGKAKDAMVNAILGLILVTLAYGLTTFVFSKLVR